MFAVAVVATSAACVGVVFHPWNRLQIKLGGPQNSTLSFVGSTLLTTIFMGAIIISASVIPGRLIALQKALKRRPFDHS
jgi:hypothetical protein